MKIKTYFEEITGMKVFTGLKMKNATFRWDEPAWANACVGNNGSPGYIEYAEGFSQAANLLIEYVLENEKEKSLADYLIYPVCFNMRHSVELRLKQAAYDISKLYEIRYKKTALTFDLSKTHDIGNIWDFFKSKSEEFDTRYKSINDEISNIILDIADIDATGQTFRYPFNIESQKHLSDVSVINFFPLRNKFRYLEEKLNELNELNELLEIEYSHGTFTKNLSRDEIFKIADELPPLTEWNEESFDQEKEKIRCKYNLSSTELGKAINIIKSHYELKAKIGELIPLKGINEEDLILFLDFWIEIHSDIVGEQESGKYFALLIEKEEEIKNKINNFWKKEQNKFTVEILSGLETLYYFPTRAYYSECYTTIYEETLKEKKEAVRRNSNNSYGCFYNLVKRPNFFAKLVISLNSLSYKETIKKLRARYNITD